MCQAGQRCVSIFASSLMCFFPNMTVWPLWIHKGAELWQGGAGGGVKVVAFHLCVHPSIAPSSLLGEATLHWLKYATFSHFYSPSLWPFPDSSLSFSFPISLTSPRQASQLFPLYTHKEQRGTATVTQGHRGHMVQSIQGVCVCVCACAAYTE